MDVGRCPGLPQNGADCTVAAIPVPIEEAHDVRHRRGRREGPDDRLPREAAEPPNRCPADPTRARLDGQLPLQHGRPRREVAEERRHGEQHHDFGKNIIADMLKTHRGLRVRLRHERAARSSCPKSAATGATSGPSTPTSGQHGPGRRRAGLQPLQLELAHLHRAARPPPAKFVFADQTAGRVGVATDSLISEGCILSGGSVNRSILSPNVRVNSYAKLERVHPLRGRQHRPPLPDPTRHHRQERRDPARRDDRPRPGGRQEALQHDRRRRGGDPEGDEAGVAETRTTMTRLSQMLVTLAFAASACHSASGTNQTRRRRGRLHIARGRIARRLRRSLCRERPRLQYGAHEPVRQRRQRELWTPQEFQPCQAAVGCASTPFSTTCVDLPGTSSLCLQSCSSAADCQDVAATSCRSPSGVTATYCLANICTDYYGPCTVLTGNDGYCLPQQGQSGVSGVCIATGSVAAFGPCSQYRSEGQPTTSASPAATALRIRPPARPPACLFVRSRAAPTQSIRTVAAAAHRTNWPAMGAASMRSPQETRASAL